MLVILIRGLPEESRLGWTELAATPRMLRSSRRLPPASFGLAFRWWGVS
jgi:hypothetical protein